MKSRPVQISNLCCPSEVHHNVWRSTAAPAILFPGSATTAATLGDEDANGMVQSARSTCTCLGFVFGQRSLNFGEGLWGSDFVLEVSKTLTHLMHITIPVFGELSIKNQFSYRELMFPQSLSFQVICKL